MTFTSHAQNYEDVLLWRALRDVPRGFYIDVGAWDPDADSVTRAFSDRGWHGINIEPLPDMHARLQQRRPQDVNLAVAVAETEGTAAYYEITGTGLSTLDPALAAQHGQNGFQAISHQVPTTTLAAICREYAPPVIHFMKVDCEGSERAALAGADFVRFRPWIILVEATIPMTETEQLDWEYLLTQAEYEFVWFDGLNRFYVAAEHRDPLAKRLAKPPCVFDNFVRAGVVLPAPAPADPLASQVPMHLSTEARIALAARCPDCADLPKVPDSGSVRTDADGTRVQVMHNGIKVLADGYCGPWMTELIAACHGHHEPQEERLFHAALQAMPPDATMIELGGNWSYYSAWFLHGAPGRRSVILEPDPANLATGQATMRLNGLTAEFVQAFAGARPAPPAPFTTERSGQLDLPCRSVPDLMDAHGMARLDLLHCDAQGAELAVLEGCRGLFAAGRIGRVFVSTHVHQITGDPLTHQRCLQLLRECGATIEAEHDPWESFSGDGLIVARCAADAPGFVVPAISYARRNEALFRDPSYDLAEAWTDRGRARLLAQRIAMDAFETLLFRPLDQASLNQISERLMVTADAAQLLRMILLSPEFAQKGEQFARSYQAATPAA